MSSPQNKIKDHYERCLKKYGDSHLGVNWPNLEDTYKRHEIMLGIVEDDTPSSLLDFGCGSAHFLDYIKRTGRNHIQYSGLDISKPFIELCREKHPRSTFYCGDILDPSDNALNALPIFDYIVINGVFTVKGELSQTEAFTLLKSILLALIKKTRKGIAFNIMSKHVDWERDDLFHLSFDELAAFLKESISSSFSFHQDYGLYEYTSYVYPS